MASAFVQDWNILLLAETQSRNSPSLSRIQTSCRSILQAHLVSLGIYYLQSERV